MRFLIFLLSFTFIFFSFGKSGLSKTLQDIISHMNEKSLSELSKEIDSLPPKEKLKLRILILLYKKQNKKAEQILKELYANPLNSTKVISNIIFLPKNLYGFIVDKTNEILYIVQIKDGSPVVLKKFKCITGKKAGDKLEEGDLRTPEGIYFPMYWKSHLPPVYGIGAFPLNYPNLLDKKILKRDGHGIWIHGTNNPHRPPHSSNGCIVLKNSDLKLLKKFVSLKRTPVVIVSKLTYSPDEEYVNERKSLVDFILTWKKAWENTPLDIKPYLSLYDKNFAWNGGNITSWIKHKKRITKTKKWIRIKISDLTIVRDGRILKFGNLYVIRMLLDYKSNNYKSITNKVLYVYKKGNKWKILGEENL